MKVQLLSDLHLEFYKGENFVNINQDADIILLLGDISIGERAIQFAKEISTSFNKKVIFVPGNHEFYHQDFFATLKYFHENQNENLFLISGVEGFGHSSVKINNVKFVGGTLWTDFNLYRGSLAMPTQGLALDLVQKSLNDFKLIKFKDKIFTAKNSLELHLNNLQMIKNNLHVDVNEKLVLLTHHGFHPNSIDKIYQPTEKDLNSFYSYGRSSWKINPGFISNLSNLLGHFDYAFHGHIHSYQHYILNNEKQTKVFANPRGYPLSQRGINGEVKFEAINHNPNLIIDI
jgi:calcineurin-like phosphoesterase family protein